MIQSDFLWHLILSSPKKEKIQLLCILDSCSTITSHRTFVILYLFLIDDAIKAFGMCPFIYLLARNGSRFWKRILECLGLGWEALTRIETRRIKPIQNLKEVVFIDEDCNLYVSPNLFLHQHQKKTISSLLLRIILFICINTHPFFRQERWPPFLLAFEDFCLLIEFCMWNCRMDNQMTEW